MKRDDGNALATRNRDNRRRVRRWSLAWALAYVGSTFAAHWGGMGRTGMVFLAVATAAAGLATILAYRRFLDGADELQRKVELDALAIAVGAGVVGGTVIHLLDQAGLLGEFALTALLMLMFGSYIVATVLGHRRYG